jgi:hypothetical protein
MDANSFLKRIILIALVGALPTFISVASPGSGGHSSSGSGGGHSSSGSGGGHSSSGSGGGHSSGGSSGGHSSRGSNGGHFASDPGSANVAVGTGPSVSGTHVRSSTAHKVSVSAANTRIFSSGGPSGHGSWDGNDDWWHHRRRLLFGFLPF